MEGGKERSEEEEEGGWVGWWGVNGEGLWVEERRRSKESGVSA